MSEGEVLDVEQLTDVDFLRHSLESEPSAFSGRFAGLSTGLCDVIENYGLLNLTPLAIERPESLIAVLELADRANGHCFSGLDGRNPYPQNVAEMPAVQAHVSANPGELWTGEEMAGS